MTLETLKVLLIFAAAVVILYLAGKWQTWSGDGLGSWTGPALPKPPDQPAPRDDDDGESKEKGQRGG